MLTYLLRRFFAQRKAARLLAEARRLFREGALDAADRACAACAALSPDPAEAHSLRASIALRQDAAELAAGYLQAAVAERDSDSSLHVRLAEVLQRLGRNDEAAAHFERALEGLASSDPTRPRAMLRLAAALQDSNKPEQAELWYRKILAIDPANRDALLCLAVMREDTDVEEARGIMDRYIALRPDTGARLRRALMLPTILQSNEHIEQIRRRLEEELDELTAQRPSPVGHPEIEIGIAPFYPAYHGRNNRDLMRKIARVCRSIYPTQTDLLRAPSGGRIRIGFVSTYFHTHSVGRVTFGLIRDLPRDRFDVHVFAIAPRRDDWAEAIRGSADRYVSLPLDLDRARRAIASAALDVLFFADIGMDPLTYFLAFWRLAPVQMAGWGHSSTSGIETIDYFVSADAIEAPGSEQYYSEKLVRLPGYFMPRYARPTLDGPRKSREQLGLPVGGHLYYCPQNLFKLHPDFDGAIRSILEQDADGEILLLDHAGWAQQLRRRFAGTLGSLASRIRFLPRMAYRDYLEHLTAVDVVLDPFHFGGCNSSCDALSLAVPVVTLPGAQLPGRFTLGLYEEIGVDCCTAGSVEQYVDIALELGREPDRRRFVSEQISARSARLFDRPDAGLALGDELLRIVAAAR